MKKIISLILCIVYSTFIMCACSSNVQTINDNLKQKSSESMFIQIEKASSGDCGWIVVYHKETKVMYAISDGYYDRGNFTLLVNPDGTPMLYEE